MHRYQSLLSDDASIHLPGLHVLGVELHRHACLGSAVKPHRHRSSQVIFYLGGHGWEFFGHGAEKIEPGTVVMLPPGAIHSFERITKRAPLCLIINFRMERQPSARETVFHLGCEQLRHIRREVTRLLHCGRVPDEQASFERATIILDILVGLLRAAAWIEPVPSGALVETNPAIRQLVSSLDPTIPLINVVRRSGYNRDYLNRLVKKDTGMTLGQLRSQQRLTKAKELLEAGMQVGSTAEMVGLPDQGYFARWFRRQTGHSPSRWTSRLLCAGG